MKHAWIFLPVVALLGCDAAASSGTDSTSTEGSGTMSSSGTGSPGGQISLSVESSKKVHNIGVLTAAANKDFLVLRLTLTNVDVSAGVPQDVLFYSVDLASNTSLQASGASAGLPDYCDAALRINPGGMSTCSVAFEVPKVEEPTAVRYTDPIENVSASASIPEAPASTCDAACAKTVELSDQLMCSDPTTAQECSSQCMMAFELYPNCAAEFDAYNNCAAGSTVSDCMCAPSITCDACQPEVNAISACVSM